MKKELSLPEIKSISIDILQDIHSFCVENKLKYSLFHGSLLGAIRHKGFIPWDDDMDIAMPRKDYEIFIKKFATKRCRVISCKTDNRFFLPWAKVYDIDTLKEESIINNGGLEIGVNVDVYPVDSVSEERQLKKIIKKRVRFERYREYSLCVYKNIFKRLFAWFFRGKSNYYSRKIDDINQRFSNQPAKYLITTEVYNVKASLFATDMFDDLILTDFEQSKFFITKNYDELLKKRLGEYMILPPESERTRHHSYKAYKIIND